MRKYGLFLMLSLACVLIVAVSMAAGCGSSAAPTLTKLSPTTGVNGAQVTISGTGFGSDQGHGFVKFGNAKGGIVSWADTKITVQVPAKIKEGQCDVRVTVDSGSVSPPSQYLVAATTTPVNPTTTPTTPTGPTFPTTPTTPTTPPTSQTQLQIIYTYTKANNISTIGVNGQQLQITLYKTSQTDPNWELWQMPLGQGQDVHYFLLHKENGAWVVRGDFFKNGSPQTFGAPSDLTITQ